MVALIQVILPSRENFFFREDSFCENIPPQAPKTLVILDFLPKGAP